MYSPSPTTSHEPPNVLLFVRHASSAEPYTILDVFVWNEPQIQVTQKANRQRYPRSGMFVIQFRWGWKSSGISTQPYPREVRYHGYHRGHPRQSLHWFWCYSEHHRLRNIWGHQCWKKRVPLKPTNVKLRPYGEDNPVPIPLVGSFFGLINTPSGQADLTKFLVLKARSAGCLLSRETSSRLEMLHIAASTTTEHPPLHGEYQYLLQKFPAVFSGQIGKFKDYQLQLNIDPTVQPVVQNSRPTPLHYRP